MAKTASLTAGLVAKKGEALPASMAPPPEMLSAFDPKKHGGEAMGGSAVGVEAGASARPKSKPAESPGAKDKPEEGASVYYKSLTVKLDRKRYEDLKTAGVKIDKKSQEIFVEALDLWLRQSAPKLA